MRMKSRLAAPSKTELENKKITNKKFRNYRNFLFSLKSFKKVLKKGGYELLALVPSTRQDSRRGPARSTLGRFTPSRVFELPRDYSHGGGHLLRASHKIGALPVCHPTSRLYWGSKLSGFAFDPLKEKYFFT